MSRWTSRIGGNSVDETRAPPAIAMIPIATLIVDHSGRLIDANEHAAVLMQRGLAELRAMSVVDVLGRDLLGAPPRSHQLPKELRVPLPGGLSLAVLMACGPLTGGARDGGTIVTLMPSGARSGVDVTALPPVRSWNDVAADIAELHGAGLCIGVGLVGLQSVNDSFSRSAGDEALGRIVHRISAASPPGSVVARTGGCRVTVAGVWHGNQSETIDALRAAVCDPISTSLGLVTVGCSLGVASGPFLPPRPLLARAERNLESALRQGAGSVVWNDGPTRVTEDRVGRLGGPLLTVLAKDGLTAHFQAVVSLATGNVIEYEAFARWEGDETGSRSGAHVIRVARDIGAIDAVGVSVLRRSLELCSHLRSQERCDVGVSVNVSTSELGRRDFASRTLTMLAAAEVPGGSLQLELTNEVVLEDLDHVRPNLGALAQAGVRFALDDFGPNAGNLFILRDVQIDAVKFQAALTTDVAPGSRAEAVLSETLQLVDRLGARGIAKGIETEVQHHLLRRLGFEYGQGFLYKHPQTETEITGSARRDVDLPVDE